MNHIKTEDWKQRFGKLCDELEITDPHIAVELATFFEAEFQSYKEALVGEVQRLNNELPSDGWNEWEQGRNQAYEEVIALINPQSSKKEI